MQGVCGTSLNLFATFRNVGYDGYHDWNVDSHALRCVNRLSIICIQIRDAAQNPDPEIRASYEMRPDIQMEWSTKSFILYLSNSRLVPLCPLSSSIRKQLHIRINV